MKFQSVVNQRNLARRIFYPRTFTVQSSALCRTSDYPRFSSSNSSQTVNSISESMISNSKSVNSLNQTPYQCQNCARLKLQLLDSGIDVSRSGYESFQESISENNLQAKNLVVRKPLKKVRSQSFIDQNLKGYHLYESQI